MIFPGYLVLRLVGRDVVIANDWSQSESIGWCRRVQVGLILCYTQALGVVDVGSLSVELSGEQGYAVVVPPVVPHEGRTTASGVVMRIRGSQAIGLRIRGFTSEGIGHEGLQTQ